MKKKNKIIKITIEESTENVYQVTRQNLHFAHSSYSKKKKKMAAKEWTDDKTFQFRNEKELIPMGKNILCKRRANETSVYVKLYSL